jgi:Antitoxin Phd_YefM, type II toxin-antitoxin system
MRIPTADFIKHYGALADRALSEPVTITKNGRDRLVVLSVEEYNRLKRRDRQVIAAGDLSEADIAALRGAEPPPESAAFDAELDSEKG